MKIISDIRLFKSKVPNIDGNIQPGYIDNKSLTIKIHRIVMKLREQGFSLGDFDHLYINFTTCKVYEKISPSQRSIDKYHPWHRYYDVEICRELFDKSGANESEKALISLVQTVLIKYFSTPEFDENKIRMCICEAITLNVNMLIKFKEKQSAANTAVIYLRYLDCGMYQPHLIVSGLNGETLLKKDLPQMLEFNLLGEIVLSSKRVAIKPRKNAYTQSAKPISFDI